MHYLIRICDETNFKKTRRLNAFALNSKSSTVSLFIRNIQKGDVLWFVKANTLGQLCYVAVYKGITEKELELDAKWDWKFEYEELIQIKRYNLKTFIKDPNTIPRYENGPINLDQEYTRIMSDEKIRKYTPLAMIAYGIRNEKEYKENKLKNEAALKRVKVKGRCTVTYEYLPESPNDEEPEVIRAFCDEYTKEELAGFSAFVGMRI
jgi:hypothetical protein